MKNGVIAFIDILGVKGVWGRKDPYVFIRTWETIRDFFDSYIKYSTLQSPHIIDKTSIMGFSDTIIVLIECENNKKENINLTSMADFLLHPFIFSLYFGIFLRGVISIGEYQRSNNLIIGPAIDEAYQWHNLSNWFGIFTAPSAIFNIEQLIEQDGEVPDLFIRYEIPVKSGIENFYSYALAWPRRFARALKIHLKELENTDKSGKMLLLEAFSRENISPEVFKKYTNTIAFYDYVLNFETANPK